MSALPLVFAIDGIASSPIDFRTPLAWLGLAVGVLAVLTLAWLALGSFQRRGTGHLIRCPDDGRETHVFLARNAAGRASDVVRCSRMLPPSHVICGKARLAEIGDA